MFLAIKCLPLRFNLLQKIRVAFGSCAIELSYMKKSISYGTKAITAMLFLSMRISEGIFCVIAVFNLFCALLRSIFDINHK